MSERLFKNLDKCLISKEEMANKTAVLDVSTYSDESGVVNYVVKDGVVYILNVKL